LDGKWRKKNLPIRAKDTAVMFVLSYINTYIDHNQILLKCI
jgi:hypothetical protein